MKALALWVLGWVLLAPLHALAQEKVELNTITAVKVSGTTVEITGSKKPNFTTFTMPDPPRLVIDISEAVLTQVPDELAVNNGFITGLRTANYGAEGSAIARVLIGYVREVETDIQVSGSVLVVKVLDPAGGTRVAQAPTETFPTDTSPRQTEIAATEAAQAERGAQQQAAAEAATTAQAGRETQEQGAATAKLSEEERRKQEEAARAEATQKVEGERRARELAAAEEKKRQEDEARATLEAKKLAEAEEKKRKADEAEARRVAAAEEKKRQEEEARSEAEAKKLAEAEEKKRKADEAEARRLAVAEEKKRQEEEARQRKADEVEARRVAAAEEKRRREDEARATAEAKKDAEAEEKRRRAAEAEAARLAVVDERNRREATRVANVAPPSRREEPVSAPSSAEASISVRRKTLEIVGFQQQAGASRVYIRTSEPVRYKVSEGRNEIVLELENTQIGKGNNTRALDTSFFDTAVARVDPTVGPDRSVRVSIKLKADVPVQTRQEGNTISLDFPRPPRP
ncbi:AMIN domain-containing protein [Hyalangium rubrum]|uniref:AMIN domain-containing protein n=1 Tax=Hyalangium rubrum TaxID=3103134 RepID=A0ABU5GVF5_9BACT|nr:AMIN domain-containing protein [Hyalangium sp. s54d21]MDY7225154.1 AMIN domain-containing protein [Hyalangium sp. s54d21]